MPLSPHYYFSSLAFNQIKTQWKTLTSYNRQSNQFLTDCLIKIWVRKSNGDIIHRLWRPRATETLCRHYEHTESRYFCLMYTEIQSMLN